MIGTDEDALMCDLAETYQLYDYRQLPATKVAVFSLGLRDSSRIKMQMTKSKIELDTMLLAGVFDKVNLIFWSKTKDAEKNRNMPKSILDILMGRHQVQSDHLVFTSGEDFEKARLKLLEGDG